jgi:TonB family protein
MRRSFWLIVIVFGIPVLTFGQRGKTPEAFPCRENAFGSTPETYGKLVTPPAAVHRVKPKYPPTARKAQIEGIVVLCVTVGKDGTVLNVRATSGPKELIPAAVKALEQWRFRPFLANNEPVEASIQIRANFRLSGIKVIMV